MDGTVPAGAAMLLDFIRETEVGTAELRGYDVIYANKQAHLPKPITRMTVAELQAHQSKGWPASRRRAAGINSCAPLWRGFERNSACVMVRYSTPTCRTGLASTY
ncbi:hypothetical protein [Pseudaminobacter sp. NGMCC 1.201702]|uniref:hypothetical protein n=1 Tax=Pseudaminobacter sp. NGMCC 1.201702 TaxID=3391825 RepID=UPI0039F0EF52